MIAPSFNYKGERNGIYCSKHKEDGMINVYAKYCEESGCGTTATFNYEGEMIAKYCTSHKKDGMINVKNKLCKSPFCHTVIRGKYEDYCLRCFIHIFPDKPVVRNYKTKEKAVIDYIMEKFPTNKYSWIYDKKIKDGCSRKRPDLMLDLGYQIIIVEVDENQHDAYDCSCENKRLMILSQDVGHRPIIFIRFNPDDYLDKEKNKILSCWKINKQGICQINNRKIKEWNKRLESLNELLQYWINSENKTEKTIEVIQLYFDQTESI